MNSNNNSSLCTKWWEYDDDYILPTIPWAPHIISYTETYDPEKEKEDKQEDVWTTVVVKKRKPK